MSRFLSIIMLKAAIVLCALPCFAQQGHAGFSGYTGHEVSAGNYQQYEVIPVRGSPFRQWNKPVGSLETTRGGAASYQADAHTFVPAFAYRRCESCHTEQAQNNRHATRAGVSCTQCHGSGVISGINYYFSPMNPIRRHGYVCAKCHEGATASFAMYLVHEPMPLVASTAESYPVFYWATWIMVAVAALAFALALPHAALWVMRDLVCTSRKGGE
ncbi:multiheme c-type cytochrome [Oleidesulfovibrio sp.]|uniref:multiheme c-type cytochrome n=1 Tax=Oleidesulfovibrio sp. TaxID=2909707 RepID=UPI003A8C1226